MSYWREWDRMTALIRIRQKLSFYPEIEKKEWV